MASLLFATFLALLSIYEQKPPQAQLASSPPEEFSSERAMRHIEAVAQQPHPVASAEAAKVRSYILNELTALGLSPTVQGSGKNLYNIVARLNGTDGGEAILLTGHYDTVAASPGAADNSSAVALILETLRALKAGPPLRNDVISLFTDGEEAGLLGAKAFVFSHPWSKHVGLVLNFDARGTRGPALMFETSSGNGWLIREYAKASVCPFANSLMYEIYKLLPNDTDFTVFKEAGYPGFNFAFIDGYTSYHTKFDNIENLDERSVQHEGSNALHLTRHFGDLSLDGGGETDAVYFDILGLAVVHYSARWVIPLTVLVVLMFVGVVALCIKSKQLTFSGASLGYFTILICMICAAMAGMIGRSLVNVLHNSNALGMKFDFYLISFVALAFSASTALYMWSGKGLNVMSLAIGGLFWWVLLMVITTVFLPTSSYVFHWPLFFSLIGLLFMLISREGQSPSVRSLAVLSVCAIPGIVLFVPVIYLLFVALTLKLSAAVMILVPLLLALFSPQLRMLASSRKWWVPGSRSYTPEVAAAAGASADSNQSLSHARHLDRSSFRDRSHWNSNLH